MTARSSFLQTKEALELVENVRQGDARATRELIAHAMDYLHPIIVAMLQRYRSSGSYVTETLASGKSVTTQMLQDDAWSITHETCVTMLGAIDTFKGRGMFGRSVLFSTWLYAIAQNKVRETLRSRWRENKRRTANHAATAEDDALPLIERLADTTSPAPEDGPLKEANAHIIRDAIANAPLTPEQKETVIMFHVCGYSQKRIAELTGVQIGTVKKRVFDGVRKLRDYIEAQEEKNSREV